jgi:hypothetical protein
MAKRRARSQIGNLSSDHEKLRINRFSLHAGGYNFAFDLISIGGLHAKLWGSKVIGVPTLAISGLPFGSPKTKCHLDVGLMERHKAYYKGEGGDFPQVWVVVSLVNLSLPMARLSTKNAQIMH